MEQTLALIKPDAVERNLIGKILATGWDILVNFMCFIVKLSCSIIAKTFYSIHEGKSFFDKLIKYMTSGSVVALILEKENAVASFRKLVGTTDPNTADDNTIRKLYALDKSFNSVHGSDSIENAKIEMSIIFGD